MRINKGVISQKTCEFGLIKPKGDQHALTQQWAIQISSAHLLLVSLCRNECNKNKIINVRWVSMQKGWEGRHKTILMLTAGHEVDIVCASSQLDSVPMQQSSRDRIIRFEHQFSSSSHQMEREIRYHLISTQDETI